MKILLELKMVLSWGLNEVAFLDPKNSEIDDNAFLILYAIEIYKRKKVHFMEFVPFWLLLSSILH